MMGELTHGFAKPGWC